MTKKNGNDQNDRVVHAVVPSKIKSNDLMAFVYWAKVQKSTANRLDVKNVDSDMEFQVHGTELMERGFSADQYAEEIKVSKTRAAELLLGSHNRPLTVCFEKADGEERTLRGRLVSAEPLLGRSMCEDLDITDKNRLRLVDHRTIRWLIVEGVRYVVNTK